MPRVRRNEGRRVRGRVGGLSKLTFSFLGTAVILALLCMTAYKYLDVASTPQHHLSSESESSSFDDPSLEVRRLVMECRELDKDLTKSKKLEPLKKQLRSKLLSLLPSHYADAKAFGDSKRNRFSCFFNNEENKHRIVQTSNDIRAGFVTTRTGKRIELPDPLKMLLDTTRHRREDWIDSPLDKPAPAATTKTKDLEVLHLDTLEAAQLYANSGMKVAVLNMANSYDPGGWFFKGSNAQEEELCRRSQLLPVLLGLKDVFYPLESDVKRPDYDPDEWALLYSPDIMVFKDREDSILEVPFSVDVISAAAPDAKNIGTKLSREQIRSVLKDRLTVIMRVAFNKCVDVLILGAFGCGAFENNVEDVAAVVKELLTDEFKDVFTGVIFAIIKSKSTNNYAIFKTTLKDQLKMDRRTYDALHRRNKVKFEAAGGQIRVKYGLKKHVAFLCGWILDSRTFFNGFKAIESEMIMDLVKLAMNDNDDTSFDIDGEQADLLNTCMRHILAYSPDDS